MLREWQQVGRSRCGRASRQHRKAEVRHRREGLKCAGPLRLHGPEPQDPDPSLSAVRTSVQRRSPDRWPRQNGSRCRTERYPLAEPCRTLRAASATQTLAAASKPRICGPFCARPCSPPRRRHLQQGCQLVLIGALTENTGFILSKNQGVARECVENFPCMGNTFPLRTSKWRSRLGRGREEGSAVAAAR